MDPALMLPRTPTGRRRIGFSQKGEPQIVVCFNQSWIQLQSFPQNRDPADDVAGAGVRQRQVVKHHRLPGV